MTRKASINRFRDEVVVSVGEEDEEVDYYFTAYEAHQMACALVACAEDIHKHKYSKSTFKPVDVKKSIGE